MHNKYIAQNTHVSDINLTSIAINVIINEKVRECLLLLHDRRGTDIKEIWYGGGCHLELTHRPFYSRATNSYL